MPKPRGFILYEGPSRLDNQPIVVIATLNSRNQKTGNMVQTFILRSDISPLDALANGEDVSICGSCQHRPKLVKGKRRRTCYVDVAKSVTQVYNAYRRGSYPMATAADYQQFTGRSIRFGAYGDPAAAPTSIWQDLAAVASAHTGYTHQARHPSFDPALAALVMISADSPKQALSYQAKGYRTFRVKNPEDTFHDNEIECLADSHARQCIDCTLCDGASTRPNIAITVHGAGKGAFNTANIIARAA